MVRLRREIATLRIVVKIMTGAEAAMINTPSCHLHTPVTLSLLLSPFPPHILNTKSRLTAHSVEELHMRTFSLSTSSLEKPGAEWSKDFSN